MMAGFVLVYLEKFFRKICPAVISMIVVPVCSLVPAVFIAHMVVGPIGWTIGNAIGDVVYAGLTSNFRFLFAGLFGFCLRAYRHDGTAPYDQRHGFCQLVTNYGRNHALAHDRPQQYCPGLQRAGHESFCRKRTSGLSRSMFRPWISCYLGVTEPALFGVNLKYGFPLVCGMIGSACAAHDFSGIRCAGHQHRRGRTSGHPLHLTRSII